MAAERKGETEADRQQKPGLEWFMERSQQGTATEASIYPATNKGKDVWSRDFIIRKINSALWAVVWAGL